MKYFFYILFLIISLVAHSQESNTYYPKNIAFYAEALGSGWRYSINYERPIKLSNKVYLVPSIGWSRHSDNGIGSRLIPVKLHVLFGKNNLYGEAGLNYIHEKYIFVVKRNWGPSFEDSFYEAYLVPELGVRYYYKFLFLKASVIPIINVNGNNWPMLYKLPFPDLQLEDKKLVIWPSLGVGVNFNVLKKKEK